MIQDIQGLERVRRFIRCRSRLLIALGRLFRFFCIEFDIISEENSVRIYSLAIMRHYSGSESIWDSRIEMNNHILWEYRSLRVVKQGMEYGSLQRCGRDVVEINFNQHRN